MLQRQQISQLLRWRQFHMEPPLTSFYCTEITICHLNSCEIYRRFCCADRLTHFLLFFQEANTNPRFQLNIQTSFQLKINKQNPKDLIFNLFYSFSAKSKPEFSSKIQTSFTGFSLTNQNCDFPTFSNLFSATKHILTQNQIIKNRNSDPKAIPLIPKTKQNKKTLTKIQKHTHTPTYH